MPVDENSAISYERLNKNKKISEVMAIFKHSPTRSFTDKEIMEALGYDDPNKVRPAITWALEDKLIYRSGKKFDANTGRTVRTCRLGWVEPHVEDQLKWEM